MSDQTKKYKIKVPVYVSNLIERDDSDSIWVTTQESMIEDVKTLINTYNSNPLKQVKSDNRAKSTTICIKCIEPTNMQFSEDKCLLLRVTAYKTNLIDGYYQSASDEKAEIRFQENDKLCSDTYFFILYPMISRNTINSKTEIYWHIFIYEDPSKANDEMARIARLIMGKIINVPIKNIKSEKMLSDLQKYKLISEVEITLSTLNDDDEEVPTYIQRYQFESKLKKEKTIKLSNMKVDDAISAFEDESFTRNYSRRQIRFTTHNKRVFSVVQEFKDKLQQTLEDSFNYSIDIEELDIKGGAIFTIDTIKKNVEGIFTRYMATCTDE